MNEAEIKQMQNLSLETDDFLVMNAGNPIW